ncbi:magnesium chelatase subunit I [Friedmanniella endophytica]|uniref:Magnesium chelatase subunit I n=1 Tax=Microlunatus kandeliicorticis TaxID=1759536 RepID=A0A7W3IW21_9ACTN|nr:sigma 54-interacting transcriptional regulator [Microlunatus kandeliicorticis]MBA8795337.1 magnesium chelatase subunit I [Microlunatus kandeliicorticis]MBA8796323.1 magnesium chelatase subunit I [Microlunatus kandeliicorticis]
MSEQTATAPTISTVGELRASGWTSRGVKEEIRANLVDRLQSREAAFPGMVGFEDSVLPELEAALLAGHDLVLLGERGQGKTRLMRTVARLLDEWQPEVAGCEIHDDPYAPVCLRCRGLAAELGEDLPVSWRHRDDRYTEKLATPDTSVGDLVGDVDPVKVAQGRTLGDPETVHYGLVPRTNRGLFGLNELPDLAERIQVALFNVLEERDIQVRGYSLRLPLDLLLIATANPEDYTNRGRIITPLKDRFGAEIRTHYLDDVHDEVALLAQEAELVAEVGDHLLEVLARFTRGLRDSSAVDQRSGVSARFAIAAAEGVAGSALRRAARTGEFLSAPVARVCDLPQVIPTLLGKIEFEMGEEGRERAVLDHLLRVAEAEVFRDRLGGLDLSGFTAVFGDGAVVETGDLVTASDLLRQLGTVPGLSKVLDRLGYGDDAGPGQVAAAAEFVLEGLYLTRRIDKDTVGGRTVYGA